MLTTSGVESKSVSQSFSTVDQRSMSRVAVVIGTKAYGQRCPLLKALGSESTGGDGSSVNQGL